MPQTLAEKLAALKKKQTNTRKLGRAKNVATFQDILNAPRTSGSETESGAKVAVGDIQPVGYSEVGPNVGPSGTSDALSFKESLDYNDEHYGKSSAQRQWELRKLKKLYPEGTSINDDPNTLQNMRVELDNIAKVDRKTAFNAAKAWMQSGFIAIGHDLKLKFNQFDQEEE
tara:strand:- start:5088 stop:5600 length:513 start_codon:yes stop_codon:yes gene_type:complete